MLALFLVWVDLDSGEHINIGSVHVKRGMNLRPVNGVFVLVSSSTSFVRLKMFNGASVRDIRVWFLPLTGIGVLEVASMFPGFPDWFMWWVWSLTAQTNNSIQEVGNQSPQHPRSCHKLFAHVLADYCWNWYPHYSRDFAAFMMWAHRHKDLKALSTWAGSFWQASCLGTTPALRFLKWVVQNCQWYDKWCDILVEHWWVFHGAGKSSGFWVLFVHSQVLACNQWLKTYQQFRPPILQQFSVIQDKLCLHCFHIILVGQTAW